MQKPEEKYILRDLLTLEKNMTDMYNTFLNECSTPAIRDTVSTMLTETHRMQHDIWQELNNRGYYPVTQAEQKQLDTLVEKFRNVSTQLQ